MIRTMPVIMKGANIMSKRIGFLYEKMLDKRQIRESIINCVRGKGNRPDVVYVRNNIDKCVDELYDMLISGDYKPTIEFKMTVKDKSSGKIRQICKPLFFPDACLQRLIIDVIKPILMRGMYPYSCASIPGRGTKLASKYTKHALRNVRSTKYAVKLDIRHYYQSIPTQLVMQKLGRKIKDKKMLALINKIITVDGEYGLCIGFYINQWLANYILEDLDWRIYGLNKISYYVRNMDDMVLMSGNKRALRRAEKFISDYLREFGGFKLKRNEIPYVIGNDNKSVDFVGFRHYHGKTALRRKNFKKLRRYMLRVIKKQQNHAAISYHLASATLSMIGQLKHCNSYKIMNKYVKLIDFGDLKDVVRKWNNRKNH